MAAPAPALQSDAIGLQPRKRRRRLHWLSWLALLLTTAAMTIIVVPGLPTDGPPTLRFPSVNYRPKPGGGTIMTGAPILFELSHGWPLVYLHRGLGYSSTPGWRTPLSFSPPPFPGAVGPRIATYLLGAQVGINGHEVAWTASLAWPWESEIHALYIGALLFDVAVALAIAAAATAACESWVRRRGGVLRWRIVDLLAVTLIVAVGLGWWKWNEASRGRQEELWSEVPIYVWQRVNNLSLNPNAYAAWEFRGPEWLARLVGNRELLPICHRIVGIEAARAELSPAKWSAIAELKSLESLTFGESQPTRDDFDQLATLPNLESLCWFGMDSDNIAWLPQLEALRRLVIAESELSASDVDRAKQLLPEVDVVTRP